MPSSGINNGTLLGIYISGTKIAHGMTTEFSTSLETREITTKDDAGHSKSGAGKLSWSGSGSFLFAEDAAYGFADLYAVQQARTSVSIVFKTGVSGDNIYTGTAWITALSMSGGVEDNQAFDASFTGTGALVQST